MIRLKLSFKIAKQNFVSVGMKIKKNDNVAVISGKDKGKSGKVLRAMPKAEKLLIESVNIIKRHQRPRKQGEKGQILQMPSPIHVSNVMLICPKCSKPTRVGYRLEGGVKWRACKKCEGTI